MRIPAFTYGRVSWYWCVVCDFSLHAAPPPQIPVEPYTRREFSRVVKRYARVEEVVNGEMFTAKHKTQDPRNFLMACGGGRSM